MDCGLVRELLPPPPLPGTAVCVGTLALLLSPRQYPAYRHGLSWIQAADALRNMKLLSEANVPLADADRYNINKFLNRLLGLPVQMQNSLFAYYTSVFRWVAVAIKAQGKMETGVSIIEGESVERAFEPEVVFSDPSSNAVTLVHSLKVDTGLAWASALRVWLDALNDPAIKSTQYGGSTGFWRQSRSNRIVLALEMPSSAAPRKTCDQDGSQHIVLYGCSSVVLG